MLISVLSHIKIFLRYYKNFSSKVDGSYKCGRCNFPMCSAECAEGETHAMECGLLARVDFEAEVEDMAAVDDHYAAILPLR